MLWITEDLRRAAALHDLAAVEHDGLTCGTHPASAAAR